jgi:hypothetical protein
MSNTTYTLEYTAEQINRRLDLINENKNLLPYKYDNDTVFPASLEDVGDGSFLTTGELTTNADIFLNDCSLPAGTYIASLEVTDLIDSLATVTNPGFSLKVVIDGEVQSDVFSLAEEKSALVYLAMPAGCATKNLLIKPMIREATTEAVWVPYMGKIGNYVDERFNGINAKLRDVLALMQLIEIVEE